MRILVTTIMLCAIVCTSCADEHSNYDAGIAAYKRGHYQAALYDFESRAMKGDPVAQFCLGFMYKHGKGVTTNKQKAEEWYTKAAKQGYVPAQNNLVVINAHRSPDSTRQEKIESNLSITTEWIKNAAGTLDNPIAQYNISLAFNLAVTTLSPKESKKAIELEQRSVKWLNFAAEQGYAPAQFEYGIMCANGSVEKNLTEDERLKEALKWYTKAAEQGNGGAQNNLAQIYSEAGDYPEALKWYKKAAEQGQTDAQFNLAGIYSEAGDYPEALKWYKKAAEQGHTAAQNNLAGMYSEGRAMPKANPEMAARWYLKAAQQGHSLSQVNLGIKFEKGLDGVSQDSAEAYYWYSLALQDQASLSNLSLENIVDAITMQWQDIRNQLRPDEKKKIEERLKKWSPKQEQIGWGTGFYISKHHILTNAHVVGYKVRYEDNGVERVEWREYDEYRIPYRHVTLIYMDPEVDLALLYDDDPLGNMDTFATFRSAPVEFGEDIVSFGYPYSDILSYSGNVTQGIVSGLSGMVTSPHPNNYFQHTAPIQGGNSGGPIFDRAGHVVGITESGLILNLEVGGYASRTVNIDSPQNVNFTIKFDVVEDFLQRNDITPTLSAEDTDSTINKEEISEKARKFTVPVLCFLNKGEDPLPVVEISINDINH